MRVARALHLVGERGRFLEQDRERLRRPIRSLVGTIVGPGAVAAAALAMRVDLDRGARGAREAFVVAGHLVACAVGTSFQVALVGACSTRTVGRSRSRAAARDPSARADAPAGSARTP